MPAPEAEALEEDGPPRTEVEQLQFKITKTTDDVSYLVVHYFLTNILFVFDSHWNPLDV